MKLALRRGAAEDATFLQRVFAWLTRYRLCSVFCHSGIVIGNTLYHANAIRGLHTSRYTPERWDLIDLGESREQVTLELFKLMKGSKYDYLGVLGFSIPFLRGAPTKLYCFEWSAMAMGLEDARWMTPEKLLLHALNEGS